MKPKVSSATATAVENLMQRAQLARRRGDHDGAAFLLHEAALRFVRAVGTPAEIAAFEANEPPCGRA